MILAMRIWEPWQFKGKQSGNIRKVKQVKPGDGQSILTNELCKNNQA